MNFSGLYTAVITPFTSDGKKIDYPALTKIFKLQDKNFVDGLIICGTTGEGPSLTLTEKENLFNFAKAFYKNRKILIGCVSSYSFGDTIEEVRIALKIGMDALLVNPPVYLKTNTKGIEEYYRTIIENSRLPVIIYNVPARSGYNLDIDILEKLSKLDLITAIKECSGNFYYVMQIKKYTKFFVLCGNDLLYLQYLISGADGIVSVISNVQPEFLYKLRKLFLENKNKKLQELFSQAYEFMQSVFAEPNPVGIKYIMAYENFCQQVYRLPLTAPNEKSKARIASTYKQFKNYLKNHRL